MDVSIIILSYNGLSDHLEETLKAVFRQKTGFLYEVIVIDSGSIDGTVDFLKKQDSIRLHEIPNSEFGHGKTRQMGAGLSSGKYVVYLTQDATPRDDRWLENLVGKLASKDEIVAVSSRILPRPEASPLRKYNVLREWCAGEESLEIKGSRGSVLSPSEIKEKAKMHDISSAYKKDFLLEHGFDDVSFGEDVLIAKKVLENGYAIAFEPQSTVLHSHNYGVIATYKRNVTDGKFNREYLKMETVGSISKALALSFKLFLLDLNSIYKDEEIGVIKKIVNILYSPIIHFAEMLGQFVGNRKI
ncbi:MAG: glycosyltransferase family 2 protein [Candidatus Moranbacteria bacterium]|jgi:rhamnosyltransferase|nr:glycosyltransferase family 2 protein [Candidatus Moranbacteria bacterium]